MMRRPLALRPDKPADIPANPAQVYAEAGWSGFGDWLGTGTVATRSRRYLPFENARDYARALGLKSFVEWNNHCKSGKKPDDIPANPNIVYAAKGWMGYGDWLGTGRIADRLRRYRPFREARAFVRALGLGSGAQWFAYCKSGNKPDDIPSAPAQTYAKLGWAGMKDWLGA